jgi:hypothetical protein
MAEQLSCHTQGHEIDKRTLATARVTEQGKAGVHVQHFQRREASGVAVWELRLLLFKGWLLCQEGCVHGSELQIAPGLFTRTLGVYPGQRHRAHLLHHPGEIRFTQARR